MDTDPTGKRYEDGGRGKIGVRGMIGTGDRVRMGSRRVERRQG